ncbi:MAG TPA: class III poly(R)-hydroxyalkanoic acid synthase subunit PhaC [Pirellulales bacterium]|jgi:polyhydroxyalkanoate synthase|nr:class III poly(R)-hydroxyalkanoic acid synthase subunit PhaC [Pirellulales bacterium]HEX4144131.1 class III poly(R)-hydroxyalkanoic acid synthase subunit PhaC [Pirellulales bacterium]
MANALLDMFFDYQRTAWSETFRNWERLTNASRMGEIASKASTVHSPHDVVYEEDSLQLLRFRNDSVDLAEPILICYALVNRPYIMDLQADRSVVRQLLKRGFDVYLIDWGVPTAADRSLRLRDYIGSFLKNVADCVCELSGSPQLNLLGYCMGGTMSTMYTALYQEQIRNLILMAAPIDFSSEEGLLNLWTSEEYFDVDGMVDAFGNCPGSFLQSTFQLRNPVANFWMKYMTFYEKMYDRQFLDNYFAMEHWANDNIPIAGETFREFVKMLYQRNELIKGEFRLDGEPVKLENITCPLLTLVADHDDLVPPSSTLALHKYVGSKDVKSMSIDAGHIGLAVSSKAHRQLWPKAAMWIADRSTIRK